MTKTATLAYATSSPTKTHLYVRPCPFRLPLHSSSSPSLSPPCLSLPVPIFYLPPSPLRPLSPSSLLPPLSRDQPLRRPHSQVAYLPPIKSLLFRHIPSALPRPLSGNGPSTARLPHFLLVLIVVVKPLHICHSHLIRPRPRSSSRPCPSSPPFRRTRPASRLHPSPSPPSTSRHRSG